MPKFPTLAHIDFAYTAVPDYFLDHIAPTLKECELKVMLYIYRRTLGYRKLADCISYDQFISGITTREGKRLDQGAGVSRRALVTALASLEQKGLISRSSGGYKTTSTISLATLALVAPDEPTHLTTLNNEEGNQVEQINQGATAPSTKRQILPPQQVRINADKVQNSPVGETVKVQDSLSTRDTESNQKIPCQNQSAAVAPVLVRDHSIVQQKAIAENPTNLTDFNQIVELLTQEIAGLKQKEAQKLVWQILANKRDIIYVKQLISYVNSNPAIHVPAAVLTTLIKTNQERQPEPILPPARPGQSRSYPAALNGSARFAVQRFSDASPATENLPAYPPERYSELWEQASQRIAERWQLDPALLAGGGVLTGESGDTLRLVLPTSDSLTRIRVSQTIKELLNEQGYYNCRLVS